MATSPKPWRDAVLDALFRYSQHHPSELISRQGLINEELSLIEGETSTQGATPEQTLTYVLRLLREDGLVEFLDRGQYRLLAGPVWVETADLSEEEIDSALMNGLLRFGAVATGSDLAQARRRRGQDRLRQVTLLNYTNRCAICDIVDSRLLVASHVRRWADDDVARGRLNNTICLCRPHDALFEAGYWSLRDDLQLLRRPGVESSMIRAMLSDATVFHRPRSHSPDPVYLDEHRKQWGF